MENNTNDQMGCLGEILNLLLDSVHTIASIIMANKINPEKIISSLS